MSCNVARLCVLICLPSVLFGCISGPSVWTPETTTEMTIDSAGLAKLEAVTHNGQISYDGSTDSPAAINVTVTKRAGGATLDDAEDALEAVDVYVEDIGDGVRRVAWRWKTPRQHRWGAEVKFRIKGDAALPIDLESHNGRIIVTHHNAEADLETYNGRIEVESEGDVLHVETHNGTIVVTSSASELSLESYNGRVMADLSGAKGPSGEITTHNGSVTLTVARDAACDLECETHNGDIDFEMPVMLQKASSDHISARLGNGGPRLDVETYNGNIKIKHAG